MIITEKIVDLENNTEEIIERELDKQEIAEIKKTNDKFKVYEDAAEARTTARAEILARLGLTADEAAILLGGN